MTFEKTYEIQKDNQLIIQLPDSFKSKKRVKVIIEDIDESRKERIELLKKASKDPLFLSDINEINSDFKDSDNETL
jgi:polynucleotide 5'-kinase involved in rRNA processing